MTGKKRALRLPKIIVSGGQTGVDRAALDAALRVEIEIGGWCPRNRRSEDGPIDRRYPLRETPSQAYRQRTEWNVRDSDATLILYRDRMSGGTHLTAQLANHYRRPLLALDINADPDPAIARQWLEDNEIRVLNIAGPREQGSLGIYTQSFQFLNRLLR